MSEELQQILQDYNKIMYKEKPFVLDFPNSLDDDCCDCSFLDQMIEIMEKTETKKKVPSTQKPNPVVIAIPQATFKYNAIVTVPKKRNNEKKEKKF